MVPVYQVEWGNSVTEPGDCLRAAVASIMNKKLHQVPHFIKRRHINEDVNEDWFDDLYQYFLEHGYHAYWGKKWECVDTGNYSIGYGYIYGREDWAHAVVCYNGTIVHDPSGEWLLKSVPYFINLETL